MRKVIPKDPEEIIIGLVKNHGFIRRKRLFELVNQEMNRGITKVPLEKSQLVNKVKFNRIIARLNKSNKLKALKREEFERFGIFDKDKRASYITLAKTAKLVKHHDKVLGQIEGEDARKKKTALIELEDMMGRMVLTPAQLNKLVELIPTQDNKIVERFVRIIYNSISNRVIFPSNLKKLEENLIHFHDKSLKVRSSHEVSQNNDFNIANTKAHIVYILGLLDNPIVLEWLKEDIQRGFDLAWLNSFGYGEWTVAKLIDENREFIYGFQEDMTNDSDITTAFQIRKQAESRISKYEQQYSRYSEKIEELRGNN